MKIVSVPTAIRILLRLCLPLLPGLAFQAAAQPGPYPNKAIRVIVPYAVGGATDVLARVTTDAMSKSTGQPFVIENRAGGGVVVGSSVVANAPADGYTLLVTTSAHSINQSLFTKLPYNSDRDFEPVAMLGKVSFVLLVGPKLEVSGLGQFIERMRRDGKQYNFGSAGLGSPMHVGPELFKSLTATNATHVPFKGETAALTALMGGHIDYMYASAATAAPHIAAGTVKPLAVTSPKRSPLLPAIPTMAELGYPNAETYSWIVLMAPGGTPREILDLLNREVGAALSSNEVRNRMATFGFDIDARLTPAETRNFIRAEAGKWAPIVKASGATAD